MKTKVLFAAALLLSASSFAQEVAVKNEQAASASTTVKPGSTANANISSSSKTEIKSNAAENSSMKADQKVREANTTVTTQKEALTGQVQADMATTHKTVQEKRNESGDIHVNAQADAGSGRNKVGRDASLNNQEAVSAEGFKGSGKELKKEGQASLNTQVASTAQITNHEANRTKSTVTKTNAGVEKEAKMVNGKAKTQASAGATTAIHSGAGITNGAKPKPASIKMNTQLKSNSGLKIK
jgi:hypothetical protein